MTTETEPALNCPKCDEPMRKLRLDDSIIDRCEKCYGIFVDPGERTKLVARSKTAGAVDIGPADVGKQQDRITDVDCPRCGVRMDHRRHPDQPHITYEICPKCHGSYFDAGELLDLSKVTFSDVVNWFVARARS